MAAQRSAHLSPRQTITPTPYAIQALTAMSATTAASADSVSAANISGTLPAANLPPTVLTNGAAGVNLSGAFSGHFQRRRFRSDQSHSVQLERQSLSPLLNCPATSLTNNASGINLAGTFKGDGAGLASVDLLSAKRAEPLPDYQHLDRQTVARRC